MTHSPTPEQSAILAAGRQATGNLIINALAGCGKTSTLEALEAVVPERPVLYLVFNKRNADEATKRMASTTTVRTFNALGHRIWAGVVGGNLKLDPKKISEIFKSLVDEIKSKSDRDAVWSCYQAVTAGANIARGVGYVPDGIYPNATRLCTREEFHLALDEEPDDLTADLIDSVLALSIKRAYSGSIDFNDQVYMPTLFGGNFPKFPLVLVDEAQDLSPINHAMVARLHGPGRRLIVVGDPFQSIYGFRGAVQGGMNELRKRYSMQSFPLSTSFRCPQAIVENARWRAPNFSWLKPGGCVEDLKTLAYADIPETSAILCRNNAPLYSLAMRLLSNGRSVSVAGSDIGPKVLNQMKRLGDTDMPRASVMAAIDDWLAQRLSKRSASAADTAECMRVFAQHGADLGQAIAYAVHLFRQQGSIQLLTGHKSKGLEFPHVIHINQYLIGDDEQDLNLRYVINTRSSDYYAEVDSNNIQP